MSVTSFTSLSQESPFQELPRIISRITKDHLKNQGSSQELSRIISTIIKDHLKNYQGSSQELSRIISRITKDHLKNYQHHQSPNLPQEFPKQSPMASRQVNNSSCDIKRRLDVITKKCTELKALGVPLAVVYSTNKTNGLYILGDPRITEVIEKHRDEILLNPDWMDDSDVAYTNAVMLAPFPAHLSMLNGLTMNA